MSKTQNDPSHLEKVIDNTLTKLEDHDPTSDEFAIVVDQLTKLNQLLPTKEPWVKPEVLITAGANLAGILAILNFEKFNVITTKAIGFVVKSRL
jgi:hypothetical protein